MRIDRNLLYAKVFYFCFYAAGSSLVPFLAVYYRSLDFNGSQIGILASISPFMMLLSTPVWGVLADISQKYKLTLQIAIAGAITMVGLLSQLDRFPLILLVLLGYAFFSAPIIPLVDSSVMSMLGPRRHLYGKQRMWGAVGWGISAPLIGVLTDGMGLHWIFFGYITWLGLGFLTVIGFPIQNVQKRVPFLQGVKAIGTQRDWVLFLLTVFISGANLAMITNYLFLYLSELGASRTLMGWGLTIATVSEIPVLFYADKLIKRFGAQGVLVLSLLVSAVRAFGYAFAPSPSFALGLQLLHGLTFSAMWAAGVTYAYEIAPPGLGATAQSIFFSVVFGFSGIAGGFIGGILLDEFGGRGMFVLSGSGVLMAILGFMLYTRYLQRRKAYLVN